MHYMMGILLEYRKWKRTGLPHRNVCIARLPSEVWSHSADQHHAGVLHMQGSFHIMRAQARGRLLNALRAFFSALLSIILSPTVLQQTALMMRRGPTLD